MSDLRVGRGRVPRVGSGVREKARQGSMMSVSLHGATGRRADANPSSSVPRASCSGTGPSTRTLDIRHALLTEVALPDGTLMVALASAVGQVIGPSTAALVKTRQSGSPARAVFVEPSPPLFETEVDAPQLSNLGLQAEGFFLARLELPRESRLFFLARLELPLESGRFFFAPLELHFESGGFLLADQQVAE